MPVEPSAEQHVIVVGAGLVGVASAWSLARRGFRVTVLEAAEAPCRVASFANAGRFVPTRVMHLNNQWRYITDVCKLLILPKSLYQRTDSEGRSLPSSIMLSWSLANYGLWFTRNCTSERNATNNKVFCDLARFSQKAIDAIIQSTSFSTAAIDRRDGNLWLYSTPGQFSNWPSRTKAEGVGDVELLDCETCVQRFPEMRSFMASSRKGCTGCVVAHQDWSADARKFGEKVASATAANFIYGARVTALQLNKQGVAHELSYQKGEEKSDHVLKADHIVLCCGLATTQLVSGIRQLPLTPMRGLSIDLHGVEGAPSMAVTDYGSNSLNYQLTPFGSSHARVVGFADFTSVHPSQTELHEHETALLDHTHRVLPGMTWKTREPTYSCWRPMTPDNLPIISPLRQGSNVWINCGHGAIGWTLSAATGELVAEGVAGTAVGDGFFKGILAALSVERFTLSQFFS